MAKLTRNQFIAHFKILTGMSTEIMDQLKIKPYPCRCEIYGCSGWTMLTARQALEAVFMGNLYLHDLYGDEK